MSVPDNIQFIYLTDEQQAAVRMWLALGLPVEANHTAVGEETWWQITSLKIPMSYWRYRLKP